MTGQRRRPVPGHRPDRHTQPGQVRGERTPDLAGPEHHMKLLPTHNGFLSLTARAPLAVSDSRAPVSGTDATLDPEN